VGLFQIRLVEMFLGLLPKIYGASEGFVVGYCTITRVSASAPCRW
jgi:hypothetical protein